MASKHGNIHVFFFVVPPLEWGWLAAKYGPLYLQVSTGVGWHVLYVFTSPKSGGCNLQQILYLNVMWNKSVSDQKAEEQRFSIKSQRVVTGQWLMGLRLPHVQQHIHGNNFARQHSSTWWSMVTWFNTSILVYPRASDNIIQTAKWKNTTSMHSSSSIWQLSQLQKVLKHVLFGISIFRKKNLKFLVDGWETLGSSKRLPMKQGIFFGNMKTPSSLLSSLPPFTTG